MALLDAFAGDLRKTADNSIFAPPPAPEAPGVWKGFASGSSSVFMQGLAQVARGASLAASTIPRVVDVLSGDDNRGERLTDAYFRTVHDPVFQNAVDHWTPKAGEVGAAGQVVGGLAAGLTQFAISPSLMVATSMLSTGEDLVRQGVDADAAMVAGDIAGLANVAGIALPFLGKTLASRMSSGAAGNLAVGATQAGVTHGVLQAAGASQAVLSQHEWADAQGRSLDVLMGVAFGGAAHLQARRQAKAQAFSEGPIQSQRTAVADGAAEAIDNPLNLSATQRDALMVLNQARHLDDTAAAMAPRGTPEHTDMVDMLRAAVRDLAQGRPIERALTGDAPQPTADYAAGMTEAVDLALPKPLEPIRVPDMRTPEAQQPKTEHPLVASARAVLADATATGKTVDQYLADNTVPAAVHNLAIGLRDAGDNAAQAQRLADDFARRAKQTPSADLADLSADAVESTRMQPAAESKAAAGAEVPQFPPDVLLPTGDFDPETGQPRTVSANDHIAATRAEVDQVKATADNLMQTAAACLLGGA
jgi:hypothetical protein